MSLASNVTALVLNPDFSDSYVTSYSCTLWEAADDDSNVELLPLTLENQTEF